MDTVLLELINAIKDLSPKLWVILLRQVQVEMIQYSITAIVLFITGIACGYFARKFYIESKEDNYGSKDIYSFFLVIILATCIFFGFVFLNTVIGQALNPEFYAIKYILSQINPGQ